MNAPRLQSFRLKNFKAVRDSGVINFTPLTVFIGGNGSGKSSIIEGLEMLHIRAARLYDIPTKNFIQNWQFASLLPQNMGEPRPQRLAGGQVKLEKDGSNIAEYLLDIRKISPTAFEGIVRTLQYVLPYSQD